MNEENGDPEYEPVLYPINLSSVAHMEVDMKSLAALAAKKMGSLLFKKKRDEEFIVLQEAETEVDEQLL